MSYDRDSFLAGLAVGMTIWGPPVTSPFDQTRGQNTEDEDEEEREGGEE